MADDERPDDPFEDLTLDEDFVRGAEIVEESADARLARLARIDAEHKRLAAEREVERAALDKSLRRRARRQRRAARGNEHRQRLVVIAVMLAIFGGLVFWNARNGGPRIALGGSGLVATDLRSGSVQSAGPPAGVGEQPEPLGAPAPLARESSIYAFIATQKGNDDPVAYDPCRAIHVVVNDRTVIPGGNLIVQDAIAAVSQATGLQFVMDGPTDELPTKDRGAYLPQLYPGAWAPVLISWTDPAESPALDGDVAGVGGSSWVTVDRGSVYVSGSIELDGPQLAEILASSEGVAGARSVIEHELGHVVGLDHVENPSQLMNPTGGTVTTYADGDLTGLSRLGKGECFPDV